MSHFTRRELISLGLGAGITSLGLTSAAAQNLVEGETEGPVLAPITLSPKQVRDCIDPAPISGMLPPDPEVRRITRKLEIHVSELIAGFPWAPFQLTHGISGYETYFGHPDRMFYGLALALTYLSPLVANRTRQFLRAQLDSSPPFAIDGWERDRGRPREAYDVPPELRLHGRVQAESLFGVYAFWAYCRAIEGKDVARTHWAAVMSRCSPLLNSSYRFDPARRSSTGEAQRLNGDLAGMIALARLARWNGDAALERQATERVGELLTLRVNLDRVNPQIVEKAATSSKHLHLFKPFRYIDLVPEVGEALRLHTGGAAANRLAAFRSARNGWYLAFGDRFLGGENYTSPPDMVEAIFAGAAYVEQRPAHELLSWVDVPWCHGDLYFLKKCTLALRASSHP